MKTLVAVLCAVTLLGCGVGEVMTSTPEGEAISGTAKALMTRAQAQRVFDAIKAKTASNAEVAEALVGFWSPRPGRGEAVGITFGRVNEGDTLTFTDEIDVPDARALILQFGEPNVAPFFPAAKWAIYKRLDLRQVGASPAATPNKGGGFHLKLSGLAVVTGPVPLSGYGLRRTVDAALALPSDVDLLLNDSTVSFETSAAFDHQRTPCLKSHVDLGGVVCDVAGPTVTEPGTGVVDLWFTTQNLPRVYQQRKF